MIDGELVINPTIPQMENSILDLRVSGTADAINMVECAADEVDEETMLRALKLAHDTIQPVIELQKQMREQIGKPKATPIIVGELTKRWRAKWPKRAVRACATLSPATTDRSGRNEALDELRDTILAGYLPTLMTKTWARALPAPAT